MHLVLGQALERYGTASGVSAWGGVGLGPRDCRLDFLGLSMPPLPTAVQVRLGAGCRGAGWSIPVIASRSPSH